MTRSTKGQEMFTPVNALMAIIIMVFSFFVITSFHKAAGQGIADFTSRSMCKTSVIVHSQLSEKSTELIATKIDCPTMKVNVKPGKVVYEYRGAKKEEKLGNKDESIKKVMANELYHCWDQFLEGRRDLFGGSKVYCSVCSVMTFDEKMEIEGFNDYLMKNPIPQISGKSELTYFDYLQGYSTRTSYADENLHSKALMEKKIDTSSSYAVVFVYAKGAPFIKQVYDIIGGALESDSGKVVLMAGLIIPGPPGVVIRIASIATAAAPILVQTGVFKQVQESTKGTIFEGITNTDPYWTAVTVLGEYDEGLLKGLGCQLIVSDKNK